VETLLLAFGAGVGTAAAPCLLPLYPSFLAFLAASPDGGSRPTWPLGFFVLFGVLSAMLVIGLVVASVGASVSGLIGYLIPLINLVLILLGVLLIADRNPFVRVPQVRVPVVRHPYGGAYVYGLFLGPIALPCAGPFLVVLFVISIGLADTLASLATFFVFGLGFGLPLLLLSLVAGATGARFARFIARHHRVIDVVAGVVLIAAAAYDLWANSDAIGATFGIG
jgi:cytochrome c-type biogenesis protein